MKELLFKIKERPKLYIKKKSIVFLVTYLNGYMRCVRDYRIYILDNPLTPFRNWIANKIKMNTTHGIDGFLLIIEPSEEKAFDLFFQYLEQYLAEDPTRESDFYLQPDSRKKVN